MGWSLVKKSETHRLLAVSLTVVCLGVACGDDDTSETVDSGAGPQDAGGSGGTDSGTLDSGPDGAAPTADAGPTRDSSVVDAGSETDAGTMDAGPDLMTAVAAIVATGETGSTIEGTVTFTQDGEDVTVVYALRNCPDGSHQTHIHNGDGCANRGEQGMHWNGARGEGIPNVECAGGTGTLTYTRTPENPNTRWNIGGQAATDVIGHPVVIHGVSNPSDRIGCGVIETR